MINDRKANHMMRSLFIQRNKNISFTIEISVVILNITSSRFVCVWYCNDDTLPSKVDQLNSKSLKLFDCIRNSKLDRILLHKVNQLSAKIVVPYQLENIICNWLFWSMVVTGYNRNKTLKKRQQYGVKSIILRDKLV